MFLVDFNSTAQDIIKLVNLINSSPFSNRNYESKMILMHKKM